MSKNRGQILPVHVRRNRSAPEHQPPLNNRRLAMMAGAVSLLAVAAAGGLLADNDGGDKSTKAKPRPSATASPQATETASAQPSPEVTTSPTETASTKPADRYEEKRRTAAQLFDRCDISNFTSDGVVSTPSGRRVRLHLDMAVEMNTSSQELRSEGNPHLKLSDTMIVAKQLNSKGQPQNKGKLTFRYGGPNSVIYMPLKTGAWAVGLETSAQTPFGEGTAETTVEEYCSTITHDEDRNWGISLDSTSIEETTTHDRYIP